ncbi:MAG: molybdenum cofactor synthesis domain containing protein [Pelosinus sp.]|jgi:molybdenum cofactor synthesis domain-containing protein|nr:molybdenum cofactor synthesis domain containing protein [Pelosinus sp.]
MSAKIAAVCISKMKGVRKENIGEAKLIPNWGMEGDAHAGKWHRQISLLGIDSIEKMREIGRQKGLELVPGDFAENLTTEGLELFKLPVGTYLKAGETLLEITQIGKSCHHHCEIFKQVGQCVMPKEGIFARVLIGGNIKAEDPIAIWQGIPVGIITASDKGSRGEREDLSAKEIEKLVPDIGGQVIDYRLLPDDQDILATAMTEMVDQLGVGLLLTTGGTGFSQRDVTPEATLRVIERAVPGLPEAMRRESFAISPRAMLSRAVAGIRGKCLIVNLPGSPKAVRECLQIILPVLPHALEILRGTGGECGQATDKRA